MSLDTGFQWPPKLSKDSANSTIAQVVNTYRLRATVNKERLKSVVFFIIPSEFLVFNSSDNPHKLRGNYTWLLFYVNIVLYGLLYFLDVKVCNRKMGIQIEG